MFYKIIPKAEYAVSLRFPRINCLLLDTIHGISLVCAGVCLYELAETHSAQLNCSASGLTPDLNCMLSSFPAPHISCAPHPLNKDNKGKMKDRDFFHR